MHISVNFPGEEAITDDEKSRVHDRGPYIGTFFNSYFINTSPVANSDDDYDFTEAYIEAMRKLLHLDSRISSGKHLTIKFVS